jgi:hypothetical protein
MSTSDQNPPLTRRQMRELRNTGSTPIIPPPTDEELAGEPESPVAEAEAPVAEEPTAPAAETQPEPTAEPEPVAEAPAEAAEPEVEEHVAPEPEPAGEDADAAAAAFGDAEDLGVAPLTRRQARQQERIHTASIPVVSADVAARPESAAPVVPDSAFAGPISRDDAGARPLQVAAAELAESEADGVVVNPAFGSELLAGQRDSSPAGASFDQIVARSGAVGGSVATPNALILSQAPASAPLVAPITANGELLVTGTFALPDGLGSTGHAPGVADGTEADAVLVDAELPASSSPTPIAASAAISTVRDSDEIIRPPAPERGSRLMLVLAITAGALALALVGVLILAFVTGVFS